MSEPYYKAYQKRYQAVFAAGAERWGHSPDNEVLYNTLKSWVEENHLQGKSIIEYACGEAASLIMQWKERKKRKPAMKKQNAGQAYRISWFDGIFFLLFIMEYDILAFE